MSEATEGVAADPTPRRFGYWAGHSAVVASMVGAGILTTSGFILRDTGNPAALLGLWAVGGLMAVCGALTVAELAAALPRAGGDYVFVREGFGRGAGFAAGWATFVIGFTAPTAVVGLLAADHLVGPWAGLLPEWAAAEAGRVTASALVAGVAAAHCLGHRPSGRFQAAATVFNLGLLVGLVVAGLAAGRGDWGHLAAGRWPPAGQWPALAAGLVYVGYTYAGWNGAAYLAGELRDPGRLVPRCLVGGTATVMAVYLSVNLTYVYALDPADMTGRSPAEVEKVAELAVDRMFGPAAGRAAASLFGAGLVAAVGAYLLTGPRVAYAMARDGLFPGFAGRLHPTRRVPVAATVAQGAAAVGLIWSGSFLGLLDYAAVGLAAVSGLVVASVFPLRRRADLPRPFRVPLYPLPPLAYLALSGWTVVHALADPERRTAAALSLATLAAGAAVGGLLGRDGPGRGR